MGDTTKEIDEMLNALGDKLPDADKGDDETDEERAAREAKEAEETEAAKQKEAADEEEKKRLAEEEARKNETEDEKKAREAKEEADRKKADEDKEKETLASIQKEKEDREKAEKEEEERRVKAEEDAKKKETPLTFEEQDFVGDIDLENLTSDKSLLNKLLNAVYAKGVNDSKKIATEGVLSTIPDIVKHNVNLLSDLRKASDEFYAENKELVPFKKVVAAVFEEIAAKNPDKKYGELMNLVAPEARKRLNLQKQAADKEKENDKGDDKGGSPRLHGAKGTQRQTPSKQIISSMENEISEMNKSIGR